MPYLNLSLSYTGLHVSGDIMTRPRTHTTTHRTNRSAWKPPLTQKKILTMSTSAAANMLASPTVFILLLLVSSSIHSVSAVDDQLAMESSSLEHSVPFETRVLPPANMQHADNTPASSEDGGIESVLLGLATITQIHHAFLVRNE